MSGSPMFLLPMNGPPSLGANRGAFFTNNNGERQLRFTRAPSGPIEPTSHRQPASLKCTGEFCEAGGTGVGSQCPRCVNHS